MLLNDKKWVKQELGSQSSSPISPLTISQHTHTKQTQHPFIYDSIHLAYLLLSSSSFTHQSPQKWLPIHNPLNPKKTKTKPNFNNSLSLNLSQNLSHLVLLHYLSPQFSLPISSSLLKLLPFSPLLHLESKSHLKSLLFTMFLSLVLVPLSLLKSLSLSPLSLRPLFRILFS